MPEVSEVPTTPPIAESVFGSRTAAAERYVRLLAEEGVRRGLIGPREVERLWQRHVLNSAVLAELIDAESSVLDIGSGAGLPGIPLALARPDLRVTLLEPMERRIDWLTTVVADLDLSATVHRGRAEEKTVRSTLDRFDVVTARAVAPLGRLAGWALPHVTPGGVLLALKGERAEQEIADEAAAVRRSGGTVERIAHCGVGTVDTPTTVVVVRRDAATNGQRTRKNR